ADHLRGLPDLLGQREPLAEVALEPDVRTRELTRSRSPRPRARSARDRSAGSPRSTARIRAPARPLAYRTPARVNPFVSRPALLGYLPVAARRKENDGDRKA